MSLNSEEPIKVQGVMRDIVIEKQISPFGFLIYKECRRKHSCISMFVSVAQWINWTTSFRVPYLWFINLLRIGLILCHLTKCHIHRKFFTQFNGFFQIHWFIYIYNFVLFPKFWSQKALSVACHNGKIGSTCNICRATVRTLEQLMKSWFLT